MRQQPRVQRTTSASITSSRAKPPKIRSLIDEQPAQKLSELLIKAKSALETELLQKPIRMDGAITLFFSFTDGLQRATVVHFTGQYLAEVWKNWLIGSNENLKRRLKYAGCASTGQPKHEP